jgi:acyl carrier protein
MTNGSSPSPAATEASRSARAERLLRIVAEKTGCQMDMLDMAMDLEADLGIDSITKAEIFAALRDSAASVSDLDIGAMAKARTLGDVVTFFG